MGLTATSLPQIPRIAELSGLSSETAYAIINAFERIREVLEIGTGVRGNSLDQWVSRRDLQNAGLDPDALEAGSDFVYEIDDFASSGSDEKPDAPTNFTVNNQVSANILAWTNPGDADFTHVEVWMSNTNNRASAYIVGLVAGQPNETSQFVHSGISTAQNYYYWIRAVDRAYNFSNFNPTSSSAGLEITSNTRATINELLNELVNETTYETTYKLYYDAFQVVKPIGKYTPWAQGTAYSINDFAKHDGSGSMHAYRCIQDHTSCSGGCPDPDEPGIGSSWTSYWEQLSDDVLNGIPVFTVGDLSGTPTVGIKGDLLLDGVLKARMIDAAEIYTMKITVSSGSTGVANLADAGALAQQDTVDWNTDITNIPGGLYQIFYQASAPGSGMASGDYWIDSDDNKIYRYNGASWNEIQDNDIAQALSDAADAQATADGKIVTFVQASAPTATSTGDLWFDSDNDYKPYRWSGSAWVEVPYDVADWAKVFGANKPEDNADVTGNHQGDINIDNVTDGVTYRKFLDTEKSKLSGVETGADVTADHATDVIYRGNTPPTHKAGRVWYCLVNVSYDNYTLYRSTGAAWEKIGDETAQHQADVQLANLGEKSADSLDEGTTYGKMPKNWKHASDTTLIDGGKIYTNTVTASQIAATTITAAQINGAGFGTLTLSSGKIQISTTDALEVAAAGNVLIKQGGDIKMEGGATGNPSLIRLGDETVPGEIRWEQSGDSTNYWTMWKQATYDRLYLYPIGLTNPEFNIGASASGNWLREMTFWLDSVGSFLVKINNGTKLSVGPSTSTIRTDVQAINAGTHNLGDATYYWNDISYKTITDRGCLGSFDAGVEMPDGRILSDLDALLDIKVDTRAGKQTVYGVPMLDYRTMPKAVYRPGWTRRSGLLPRDANDEPYEIDPDTGQKIPAADGAEMSSMISIILGAIKQLNTKIENHFVGHA